MRKHTLLCSRTILTIVSMASKTISLGQFNNKSFQKANLCYGLAQVSQQSSSISPKDSYHALRYLYPITKFFLLVRENDLDLRPPEAMLMRYAKHGAYVERGSGGFGTRKKIESTLCRSWENAIKMARLETYTHTLYNCQDHRPYPPPHKFYAGIRRIRKMVLENIGGATAPLAPLPGTSACNHANVGATAFTGIGT